MRGQMSIYDFIADISPAFNPVENLAHYLVWGDGRTPTRERLIRRLADNELTDEAVRKEYCPYGFSGQYLHPKNGKVHEYDMRLGGVAIAWVDDDGAEGRKRITWQELADAIRKELEDGQSES